MIRCPSAVDLVSLGSKHDSDRLFSFLFFSKPYTSRQFSDFKH